MKRDAQPRSWSISGLRMRYTPRSRIGQGLLSISPWVDILLLLLFFLLIDRRLVLQPGVVIDMPSAPFRQGTQSRLVLVVMSVRGLTADAREDIVFFDDERYRIERDDRRGALRGALAQEVSEGRGATLILHADQRVSHGTVMDLMTLAREVGIEHVNVATRPL